MDLNANFHGVPVKYWLVGASATGFMGFVLYRRRKAKAAASQATTDSATSGATGPLPGWAGLSDAMGPPSGSGGFGGNAAGVDGTRVGHRVSVPEGNVIGPITSPVVSPPLPTVSAPPQANFTVNDPMTNPYVSPAAPINLPTGALLGPATGVGQRYVSGGSEFTYG